jgi:hypothetical protein
VIHSYQEVYRLNNGQRVTVDVVDTLINIHIDEQRGDKLPESYDLLQLSQMFSRAYGHSTDPSLG